MLFDRIKGAFKFSGISRRRRRFLRSVCRVNIPVGYGTIGCCATMGVTNFPMDGLYWNTEELEFCRKMLRESLNRATNIARKGGRSIIVATINTEQSFCEEALRDCGFEGPRDWAYRDPESGNEHETGVKLFYKHVYTEGGN